MGCYAIYTRNKMAKRIYCKPYKELCDKRKMIVDQIIQLEKMEE